MLGGLGHRRRLAADSYRANYLTLIIVHGIFSYSGKTGRREEDGGGVDLIRLFI